MCFRHNNKEAEFCYLKEKKKKEKTLGTPRSFISIALFSWQAHLGWVWAHYEQCLFGRSIFSLPCNKEYYFASWLASSVTFVYCLSSFETHIMPSPVMNIIIYKVSTRVFYALLKRMLLLLTWTMQSRVQSGPTLLVSSLLKWTLWWPGSPCGVSKY